ncbi:MAG: hypothetical protein WC529_04645 [Candidatus Margulisiibacteriota bacterium]
MKKAILIGLAVILTAGFAHAARVVGAVPTAEAGPRVIATPVQAPLPKVKAGSIIAEAGTRGGAGVIGAAFVRPLSGDLQLQFGLGAGLGNSYTLIYGSGSVVKNFGQVAGGIGLDICNYSAYVQNLPLMPAVIDKGARIGLGVFLNKEFGAFGVQAGFSSASGITLVARRAF